jgi:hypothetical protein
LGANVVKGIPDSLARNVTTEEETNGKFFKWFGGRKMFLALLFIITITVAFFIPTGTDPKFLLVAEWLSGMEWCLIIYLGANAVDAVPDMLARWNKPAEEPTTPATPPAAIPKP